jgi:exopolysaccharide biosynthesis polyprenyl glycosylphosphotransferase
VNTGESRLIASGYTVTRRSRPKHTERAVLYAQLLLLDCLAVTGGFAIAALLFGEVALSPTGFNIGLLVMSAYVLQAVSWSAYSIDVLKSLSESTRRSLGALAIAVLAVLMLSYFFQASDSLSRVAFGSAVTLAVGFLGAERFLFHVYVRRKIGKDLTDELLIIDGVPTDTTMARHVLDASVEGLRPDLQNPEMLSYLANCIAGFDRVVVSCPPERQHAWSLLLKGSNVIGEIMFGQGNTVGAMGLGRMGKSDTLIVSRGPLSVPERAKKRLLDLVVTVPALIALSPLMLVVAIAVKLESRGPVFFKQRRVGRSNQLFDILKFRSMRAEVCDSNGNHSTQRDDDRITRVGAFIRKTSIDELPQLINVLRGDMSLVGPRPHALGSLAGDQLFWEVNERYWTRHALKPGITGLAQVRGFRGNTERRIDLENRLNSDLEYVRDWSLWRDISILAMTCRVVLHRNAY